jgi:thiol-disulfide isomerase/thioredoxin
MSASQAERRGFDPRLPLTYQGRNFSSLFAFPPQDVSVARFPNFGIEIMNSTYRTSISVIAWYLGAVLFSVSESPAQIPAAATPPATAAPAPPSAGIRNKLSAGDLLSAESVLEVYRTKNGEDGPWLTGLSWLARGALLLGEWEKAEAYAAQTRTNCADRIARGTALDKDHDLETAYGAAIEVEAQLLQRSKGAREAAECVRSEIAKVNGPAALISRLNKRLNMLSLKGQATPELIIEDFTGDRPPALESMRGKPLLLFIWNQGCGDCKAQAAALAHVKSRYELRGLQLMTLTRYYDDGPDHAREKFLIDSVWKSVYAELGTVPMVISTASMERYGGSSTPTFVFVDKEGIVRRYTPTRLTEEELNRTVEELLR